MKSTPYIKNNYIIFYKRVLGNSLASGVKDSERLSKSSACWYSVLHIPLMDHKDMCNDHLKEKSIFENRISDSVYELQSLIESSTHY